MADTKLSAETELTQGNLAAGDLLYVVDVSDTTDGAGGSSRKIQATNILAPARLTAITNGSPADGDLWYGSTQKSLSAQLDGIKQHFVGCLFSQVADATVANTTTETTLVNTSGAVGTPTLPANFLVVGKTVRIRARGIISTKASAPGPLTMKVKLGTAGFADPGNSAVAGVTNGLWEVDFLFTCRTAGASGTVRGQGHSWRASSAFGAVSDNAIVATADATVDTTASQAIDLTAHWSTADVGNTITCTNLIIEVLN